MANLIRKIAQSSSNQTTPMIISSNDSTANRYLGFDAGESSVSALTYLNGELHDLKKRVEKLEERPLIYTTRLNDLLTERYILSHPVDIVIEKAEDILYVPIQAVYTENGKSYVDLLVSEQVDSENMEQAVNKVEVTTGINDYSYIEIKSGLKEGDIIVTSRI